MSDHGILILTRNSLQIQIFITKTRAIAQLGRAPRLHARQSFFRGVHHAINRIDLILLKNRCLTPWIRGDKRTIA